MGPWTTIPGITRRRADIERGTTRRGYGVQTTRASGPRCAGSEFWSGAGSVGIAPSRPRSDTRWRRPAHACGTSATTNLGNEPPKRTSFTGRPHRLRPSGTPQSSRGSLTTYPPDSDAYAPRGLARTLSSRRSAGASRASASLRSPSSRPLLPRRGATDARMYAGTGVG